MQTMGWKDSAGTDALQSGDWDHLGQIEWERRAEPSPISQHRSALTCSKKRRKNRGRAVRQH